MLLYLVFKVTWEGFLFLLIGDMPGDMPGEILEETYKYGFRKTYKTHLFVGLSIK